VKAFSATSYLLCFATAAANSACSLAPSWTNLGPLLFQHLLLDRLAVIEHARPDAGPGLAHETFNSMGGVCAFTAGMSENRHAAGPNR
jgi:hypothetical protein